MEPDSQDHPFELLCTEATLQRWCWNIQCGTCGSRDFRRALWRLAAAEKAPTGGALHGNWPVAVQEAVVGKVESAAVERIVREAPFPDGLGYLGLVLAITSDAEAQVRRLTSAWVPRLATLLKPEPGLFDEPILPRFFAGPVLRWQDLEALETTLRREH